MSLKINSECINCDVCEPLCPNEAIYMGLEIYEINPLQCTECVGHYDEPNCVAVCPVDAIHIDPAAPETRDSLWLKFQCLKNESRTAAHAALKPEASEIQTPLPS